MDFKKLITFIEENKNEHFTKVIAENKRILAENKARQKKDSLVSTPN